MLRRPPARRWQGKYDDTAAAMIALLKYGCGLPFHRIERLEQGLAIPMPVGTQWEVRPPLPPPHPGLRRTGTAGSPGTVVYNDDTTMRILTLTQRRAPKRYRQARPPIALACSLPVSSPGRPMV
ncbi:MAG: hypothetical protein IPJ27_23465 [Candidatus Accumulibacter sp.]|uniref:Transposase n=1 Tax=Candidatus Accumulibacter proximus TaxID=2954385 RepID=A0A935UHV1_9PROT|nr:hypothetical protein [Candidatus Accumulibacter proximus]